MSFDGIFKICLFGDAGCGKTTLAKRYMTNKFISDTKMTIGVSLETKTFKLDEKVGSLEQGKFADLFIVDLNDINFYSAEIESSLFHPLIVQRTKAENIKKVYIKGNQVFKR